MEAGKAPPKSRGEHASRACRLHVPFNFTVTDVSSSLPHHTHVFAPCMRHEGEAVRNTGRCDEDFFRSHAGSIISDIIPLWLRRIVINRDL